MATFRSRFSASYEGIGLLLKAPFMVDEMKRRAEIIRNRAEETAPVGDPRRDPHSGLFKNSFHAEANDRGGFRGDRAEGIVYNDAPNAIYAEKGTSRQRGYHTLLNAIEAARD
jgi:hypothetical protein